MYYDCVLAIVPPNKAAADRPNHHHHMPTKIAGRLQPEFWQMCVHSYNFDLRS